MELDHLAPAKRTSWVQRLLEFGFFFGLFAAYDAVVLSDYARFPDGLSLIDYAVRDGRTDESAMYWPFVQEVMEGNLKSADPYLAEYKKSRDIKPRIPTRLCAAIFWCTGNVNLAVLIVHALFPAIAAMLLVEIGVPFLGRRWSFVLAILSAVGVTYSLNEIVTALRIAHLGGPARYNPFVHLVKGSAMHMEIQRYFSPGLTLAPFLLAIWLLVLDPEFKKRRTLILVGLVLGIHTEIYIHGAVTLGVFVMALLGVYWLYQARQKSWKMATRATLNHCLVFLTFTFVAALPWLLRFRGFSKLQYAKEIMLRVGNFDFTPDIYRLPMLAWMMLAIYLRHVASLQESRDPASPKRTFLSGPCDRFWLALLITIVIAGWFGGIAGELGYFPCSQLICFRYLSYLAPLMVAYPLGLLIQQWLTHSGAKWKSLVQGVAWGCMSVLLGVILYGEYRAARNCTPIYAITPEMARIRDEVLPATPSRSVILTDDLRLTSYLACESDRDGYVGYASVCMAPTGELIDRLMIASILVGLSFDEFEEEHYKVGFGFPNGPSGAHWVLHHGGDIAPVPRPDLVARYEGLKKLSAEELTRRYRFDFAFFSTESPVAPYSDLLLPTDVKGLYRLASPQSENVASRGVASHP